MSETSEAAQRAAQALFEEDWIIGHDDHWPEVAEIIHREMTRAASAEVSELRQLLGRAVLELSYCHAAEVLSLVRTSEGESIVEEGMKLLGLKDLSEESMAALKTSGNVRAETLCSCGDSRCNYDQHWAEKNPMPADPAPRRETSHDE